MAAEDRSATRKANDMSHPPHSGAGGKLILAVAILSALWTTYEYGGRFYDRSAPILNRMLNSSDLWLWSDLFISLWYPTAYVVFFVAASIATHLLLSILASWVLTPLFF